VNVNPELNGLGFFVLYKTLEFIYK